MPCIAYRPKKFSSDRETKIVQANQIIEEYRKQGFELTLRQLYYQFVSRGFIPNNQREYKNLGDVINDARLAGRIDWDAIVDRTRNLQSLAHWATPTDIIKACASQFRIDKWADQPRRVEVWIEKDALVGVIEPVCQELDVAYFSCRGYTSQSEMWVAAMRLRDYYRNHKQDPLVLHFGDHDPSGIDMTRDIQARLQEFAFGTAGHAVELRRLALNMDQVRLYNPPPNPAKITDSRAAGYIEEHGNESWELDALEPVIITELIRREITRVMDMDKWAAALDRENEHKRLLSAVSDKWTDLTRNL